MNSIVHKGERIRLGSSLQISQRWRVRFDKSSQGRLCTEHPQMPLLKGIAYITVVDSNLPPHLEHKIAVVHCYRHHLRSHPK